MAHCPLAVLWQYVVQAWQNLTLLVLPLFGMLGDAPSRYACCAAVPCCHQSFEGTMRRSYERTTGALHAHQLAVCMFVQVRKSSPWQTPNAKVVEQRNGYGPTCLTANVRTGQQPDSQNDRHCPTQYAYRKALGIVDSWGCLVTPA